MNPSLPPHSSWSRALPAQLWTRLPSGKRLAFARRRSYVVMHVFEGSRLRRIHIRRLKNRPEVA